MSDKESDKCQKAYGKGFEKGRRGEGRLGKELSDLFDIAIPDPLITEESKSHNKGLGAGLEQRDLHGGKNDPEKYSPGGSSSNSSSSAGSSTTSSGGGSGPVKVWLIVVAGFAILVIFGYSIEQQNRVTNVASTRAIAQGVPVYNLQCGQTFDTQLPPTVRTAFLVVPPCKCSDLSELNYDCTGWVRIAEPNSRNQITMMSVDGSQTNECIALWEYGKGRGPRGVAPGTPLKIAGCSSTSGNEISVFRTKDNPEGQSLAIPDRFTVQNVQEFPITVRVDFY